MKSRLIVSSLLAALLAPCAHSQQAEPILREGDALPSVGAGHTVSSLSNAAVNGVGGYSITLSSSDGVSTLSSVYGTPNGALPGVIQTEAVIGTLDQTSFESFHGIDDIGNPCYSALSDDTVSGFTSLDGAWVGNAVLALEDDPIPALPGKVWRFASRPGISNNSIPFWIGGINDATTGNSEGNGLFLNGLPVLMTGDLVPGLPGPLDGSAVDFDYRFSAMTTHYITATDVVTGGFNDDAWLVLDGAPIATSLGFVAEDQPLPGLNGGLPGEKWDNFDSFGINEAGEYFWTGDTDGIGTGTDEYVSRDGKIIYREGDVIDGETLTGSIEAAYMNEAGDIVFIWDVEDAVAGDVEALFLNGKLLLKETDPVDLDGDGLNDPGATISGFTGSMVVIGADRKIYFTADVDTMGTSTTTDDTEVFYVIEDPCGSVKAFGAGCPGTGGFIPQLQLTGCSQEGGSVSLEITRGLGATSALVFFGLGKAELPLGGGCTLNISGVLPSIIVLPMGGALPGEGNVSVPAVIPTGTAATFTMQAFVNDPSSLIGASATNGLEITIIP